MALTMKHVKPFWKIGSGFCAHGYNQLQIIIHVHTKEVLQGDVVISTPLRSNKPLRIACEKRNRTEGVRNKGHLRRHEPAVITCKKSALNFYPVGSNRNEDNPRLASQSWLRSKSKGDYFIIHHQRKTTYKTRPDKQRDFAEFGFSPQILESLSKRNISTPTIIQEKAIPEILHGSNVLCCAETGSGKTLAYVLPVLEKVLKNGRAHKFSSPSGVILVPTTELVQQIKEVVESFCESVGLSVYAITKSRHIHRFFRNRTVDILIASPFLLEKMAETRKINLDDVHICAVDEADTLLDDSFNHYTTSILSRISIKESGSDSFGSQVVLVSATIPRSLSDILGSVIDVDKIVKVSSEAIHTLQPHVPHKFCRVSSLDRADEILRIISEDTRRNIRAMVFCNSTETSWWLSAYLKENNIRNLLLNGEMNSAERKYVFTAFQEGQCNILVCTDLASHGLDTKHVAHVVNFDFPRHMSDYLHRSGRVGRLQSSTAGHVTSFVTFKSDVFLTQFIEASTRNVKNFTSKVNANIARRVKYRRRN